MAKSGLMAKAVTPLEDEMVERVRPVLAWTSLPAGGWVSESQFLRWPSGPLLQKSPLEELARQLQFYLALLPALDMLAPQCLSRSRKARKMRYDA
jgi:hypothetical protein